MIWEDPIFLAAVPGAEIPQAPAATVEKPGRALPEPVVTRGPIPVATPKLAHRALPSWSAQAERPRLVKNALKRTSIFSRAFIIAAAKLAHRASDWVRRYRRVLIARPKPARQALEPAGTSRTSLIAPTKLVYRALEPAGTNGPPLVASSSLAFRAAEPPGTRGPVLAVPPRPAQPAAAKLPPWRGPSTAAAAHLLVLIAALGLVHLTLPQPAPQGNPISLIMAQTPASGALTAAAASQAQPPAMPTPPRQPLPAPNTPPMPSLTKPDMSTAQIKPQPPKLTNRPAAASLARAQGSHTTETASQASYGITRPAKALSKLNVYYALFSSVGQQGQVGLEVWVLPDGLPGNVIVVRSSGYEALDNVARNAVLGFRFQPALKRGVAVASVLPYVFRFEPQH